MTGEAAGAGEQRAVDQGDLGRAGREGRGRAEVQPVRP
jgi:hypothetical protein